MNDNDVRKKIKRAGLASYWLRKYLAIYQRRVPSGCLILDIGSGDSPYREFWRDYRYFSIDISNREADVLGDIYSIPIRSNSADTVLCTEVLEHVFETEKALAELNRIIKNGGFFLLSTPFIIGRHDKDFFRFTPESLSRLLSTAGFENIEIQARGGIFSALGLLLTHIPNQALRNKNSPNSVQHHYYSISPILRCLFYIVTIAIELLLRPLAWLDRLDSKKDFTMGYVVFSRKKK